MDENISEDPNVIAGQRLKAARIEINMSRDDCARAVGLKSGIAILRYENGKRKIPINLLPRFADIFDTDINYFFTQVTPTSSGLSEESNKLGRIRGQRFDVLMVYGKDSVKPAEQVATELRGRGIIPWLDTEQIRPGMSIQDSMQEAIQKINSATVIIGPDGLGKWEALELKSSVSECVERGIPVIPVLLPGVEKVPSELAFLAQLAWVRFKENLYEEDALEALVWGITGNHPGRN